MSVDIASDDRRAHWLQSNTPGEVAMFYELTIARILGVVVVVFRHLIDIL